MIYVSATVAVDDCLGMGGIFNYATMTCDFEKSRPYVPFSARHPGLLRTSGACVIVGMVVFEGTMLRPGRNPSRTGVAGYGSQSRRT